MQTRQPFGGLADDFGDDDIFAYDSDDDMDYRTTKKSRKKNRSVRAGRRKPRKSRRRRRGLFRRLFRRRRRRRISRGVGGKVKYTKHGQPYIILKSGKARFIKGRRLNK